MQRSRHLEAGRVAPAIRVYESGIDYIDGLASLPLPDGTKLALSFLPVTLFPRDIVLRYYARDYQGADLSRIASGLHHYRRRLEVALRRGTIEIALEVDALRQLCLTGRIHAASQSFEVGATPRLNALIALRELVLSSRVRITRGPLPYVFALRPPASVLLDVDRNVAAQRIQGILLEDVNAFLAFSSEFARLTTARGICAPPEDVAAEIDLAVAHLRDGLPYRWTW